MEVNTPSTSNYHLEYGKLERMFAALESTGEVLPMDVLGGLKNISVPIIQCGVADEAVRASIVSAVYETVTSGWPGWSVLKVNTRNLTLHTRWWGHNGEGWFDQTVFVGYYSMRFNGSLIPSLPNVTEIWCALANPWKGERSLFDDPTQSYTTSYYACNIRNASVTATISFIDNVQSFQVSHPTKIYFNSPQNSDYPLRDLLYQPLDGYAINSVTNDSMYGYGWNNTMDQTVFSKAKDFAVMTGVWNQDSKRPDHVDQNKDLVTLIEEFSLNASIGLMSTPEFRQVLTKRKSSELS